MNKINKCFGKLAFKFAMFFVKINTQIRSFNDKTDNNN